MQFSEKLKKLRAEKGVSQSELAEQIYVSRSAVAKWENGLGLPSRESLNLLAEFFEVEKSELLSDRETAHEIINKNHTLSKQKLWIIVLVALSCALIIVAAILITLALGTSHSTDIPGFSDTTDPNLPDNPNLPDTPDVPDNPNPEPTYVRELIFETEKDIADLNITNYSDSTISTDKYFAPTRILTYDSTYLIVPIPNILIKCTYGDEIYYTEVQNRDIHWPVSENCDVKYSSKGDYIYVLPVNEPYGKKTEYCINLAFADMRLSIKIKQEPIRVENIEIELDSRSQAEVQIGEQTLILTDVAPTNADYRQLSFKIDKIVRPDKTRYGGDLSKYVEFGITEYGSINNPAYYIQPKAGIESGSEIYFYAVAENDNVYSNILKATVTRIYVSSISLDSDKYDSLVAGDTCTFSPKAYPFYASFNTAGEQFTVTLLTPNLATLTYVNGYYHLTATDNENKLYQKITVLVSTPEGYSKYFYWTINGTPVERISLSDANTGYKYYPNNTYYMGKGSSTTFAVDVYPENAVYSYIEFRYFSENMEYFEISDDGYTITISEFAPGGIRINFLAYAYVEKPEGTSFYSSGLYTIAVQTVALTGLTLIPDSDTLVKGETTGFTFEYYPANADVYEDLLKLYIVNAVDGVSIVDNKYVYVDYSVAGGTEVRLVARHNHLNDILSNIVTLTVQKLPVESVALGIESFGVAIGELLPLTLKYNQGADVESVEYKLLDEAKGVYIVKDYLYVSPDAVVGTKFRLQAVVDGVESNILNIEIFDSPQPEEIIEVTKRAVYHLDKTYYPDVPISSLNFIMLGDIDSKEIILAGRLIYIYPSAVTGTVFRVMAIVDGVADRVFTFKVVDPPEEQSTTVTTKIQAEEFKRHGY